MTTFLQTAYIILWAVLALYVIFNFLRDWKRRRDAEHELARKMWLQEIRRRVAAANEREG